MILLITVAGVSLRAKHLANSPTGRMILLDGFHNLEEISSYKEVQFGKVWLPAELVRRVHILISRLGTR